jgi:hypothetical protein
MDDAERRGLRGRAHALDESARQGQRAAEGLEAVADEVVDRLAAVVGLLTPSTWAGRVADEARDSAWSAADDLRGAAARLHAIAAEIRAEALGTQQRAVMLRRGATSLDDDAGAGR